MHELARKRPVKHALRDLCRLEQSVEIDTCLDTHLVAHVSHVLCAHVSRSVNVGVSGERTTSEARDRAVEHVDAHLQCGVYIRRTHAASIVQVKTNADVGGQLPDRADAPLDV